MFPAETGFRIAADEQTNSLLVSATDQDHAQVKEIVQAFDVAGQTANPPQSTVQQQTNKNSVEIETGPADTVILKGSKENVAAAEQMLKQMSSQQLLDHSKSLPDKASNTSNPAQKKKTLKP